MKYIYDRVGGTGLLMVVLVAVGVGQSMLQWAIFDSIPFWLWLPVCFVIGGLVGNSVSKYVIERRREERARERDRR